MMSRAGFLAAAVLGACHVLPAQEQGPQPDPQPGHSMVHVRVVDAKGGPVQRCRVRLLGFKDPATAAAGRYGKVPSFPTRQLHPRDFEDGWCTLQGLPQGRFVICCEAELHANAVSEPFTLPADGRVEVTIVLPRGAAVTGKVVDGAGQPVAGAEVAIRPPLPVQLDQNSPFANLIAQISETPLTHAEARTDRDGAFRIEHVTPGSYEMIVRHPAFCALRRQVEVAADDRAVDDLALEPGCLVRGTVKGGGDGFVVLLSRQGADGPQSLRARVGADGTFRFAERVPAGEWQLATSDEQAKDPFTRILQLKATQRALVVGPDQAEVVVEFEPPPVR